MKTKEELWKEIRKMNWSNEYAENGIVNFEDACKFADQEKQALKEKITHEATVDSIIWEVLQIDRMSNQEFDSERERRHLQIRKVQEILKSI